MSDRRQATILTAYDHGGAWLSATEQIGAFKAGKLSPVDVLKAQMERIEKQGEILNAVTFTHFEEALTAAQGAEQRYREGRPRLLEGITVVLKDEFAREGWIVTQGSRLFKDEHQKEDHPVVGKLREAGAILHVQGTAPELYLVGVTWSDLWGVTRNPWNTDVTPGGSSGGPAALVAAGMATLGIGSDMGGSIRIPAALTGLYGSKPAYGRIPSPDPSALVPHASPGPLARTLRDLMLLQNVMMGPAKGCPSTLSPKLELALATAKTPRRVAFCLDQGWARLDPDVTSAVRDAVRLLERAGHTVEEVLLDLDTAGPALRKSIEKALFSTALGAELIKLKPRKQELTSYARRFVELADSLGPSDAKEAAEETLRFYEIIEETVFAKGFDALISPTVATTRVPAAFDPTKDVIRIGDSTVDPYSGWFLTSVFSLLNWMPAINVPAGLMDNGVPCGFQIVTRPYEDSLAYELAADYADQAEPLPFSRVLG